MQISYVEHIEFERGREALNLESQLKKIASIRAPKGEFPGGTELFIENPINYGKKTGII